MVKVNQKVNLYTNISIEITMERKVWFITGCSNGFGLELVKELLNSNTQYSVAATTRSIKNLIENLKNSNIDLSRFLPLEVDLTKEQSIKNAVDQTIQKFGQIDVLVNNAGFGIFGSIEESTSEDFHNIFEINVFAVHRVIQNVLPFLREKKNGCILNLSSIAGIAPRGGNGLYAATKAALIAMTESLRKELSELNIKCCAICPGPFHTNFQATLQVAGTNIPAYSKVHEATNDFLSSELPGDPHKAARAIIKLSSIEEPPGVFVLGQMAFDRAKQYYSDTLNSISEFQYLSLDA